MRLRDLSQSDEQRTQSYVADGQIRGQLRWILYESGMRDPLTQLLGLRRRASGIPCASNLHTSSRHDDIAGMMVSLHRTLCVWFCK